MDYRSRKSRFHLQKLEVLSDFNMNEGSFRSASNLMSVTPQGHEKTVKQAFYNAVGLFILLVCVAGGWALFYVFEPFVKPLIWALLIGSALHPVKHTLAQRFELWFQQVNKSSTPLCFGFFMVPVKLIDDISECIGSAIMPYIKLLSTLCFGVLTVFLIYTYTPNFCITLISYIFYIIYNVLQFTISNVSIKVFLLLVIAFGTVLVFYGKENKMLLTLAGYPVWLLTISLFIQTPVFLFILLALSFRYVCAMNAAPEYIQIILKFLGCRNEKAEENTKEISKTKDPAVASEQSTKYLYAVVWACALMMIWKNFWLLHILPIPVAIYLVKHMGVYFGFWNLLISRWSLLMETIMPWIKLRKEAIIPPPIQGLYWFVVEIRDKIMNEIKDSISSFASCLVIFGLISFTFCFSFFIIFQVYAEGIQLVKVGANVINCTVVNNPEFLQLLPEGWGEKMETVLNDAYVYGRQGISKQIENLLRDVDPVKSSEFEKHVLELWDRVYQAWLIGSVEPNSNMGPKVDSNAVFSSWDNFLGLFQKMPDLFNVTVMTDVAKENIGTLLSLLESVWILLKGNLSLISQFLLSTLSLILDGGTAVLNFLMSTIVFFTALFYLLSSSGELYKPVEWMSTFSPINGSKLGNAFEAAVNGVFKATFKMALFYGLWTWLIHNLFQVRIVYLPSVLAAVLGAVPFLGTYWAAIPAVLDLWLVQQKGMKAFTLLVFQWLPISFVDTAIYKEIKGCHPYITGLAIAGGVFCMGIQGAIFGPVLLCCLIVALNMTSNLMKNSKGSDSTSSDLSLS